MSDYGYSTTLETGGMTTQHFYRLIFIYIDTPFCLDLHRFQVLQHLENE